jgi:hypothetical protein
MNYTRKFGLPLWNNEEGGVVSQYYFDTSSRPGHSLLYGQVTFYGLPAEVAKVAEKLDDELPKITEEWDI